MSRPVPNHQENKEEPTTTSGQRDRLVRQSTTRQGKEEEEGRLGAQPINNDRGEELTSQSTTNTMEEEDEEEFNAQPFANSQGPQHTSPDGNATRWLPLDAIKDIDQQAYNWNGLYSGLYIVLTLFFLLIGFNAFEEWHPIWELIGNEWEGIF
jgi:hypothetical protein